MDIKDIEQKKKFVGMIKALAFNAGITVIDNSIIKFYENTLKQYPIETLEKAGRSVLKTWVYPRMPPIAEILKAIDGEQPQLADHAVVQADKILTNIKYHGAKHFPQGLDKKAKHLMETTWRYQSWAERVATTELVWWKKEFIESYKSLTLVENENELIENQDLKKLAEGIG